MNEAPRLPSDSGVVGVPPVSPPSFVVRRMREIDPRLALEWRPLGVSWGQPDYQPTGCWRIILRSPSGRVRGLRNWPPDACDGRLLDYLETHWLPRVRGHRSYHDEHLSEAGLAKKEQAAEREKRAGFLKDADHGEMWYTLRREHAELTGAGWSGRTNFALGSVKVTDHRACAGSN